MSKRSKRTGAALLVLGIGLAGASLWSLARLDWQSARENIPNLSDIASPANAQTQPAADATPSTRNPLSTGEMATFVFKPKPDAIADVAFVDGTGKDRRLSDWKGRVVLLNLWATWCVPCRKEMPALERLQIGLGSDAFEVVALAVDRTGAAGAKKFLADTKVERLGLYVDGTAKASSALKVIGLPTTILIGRDGLEIGRLVGPAEWDSEDAKRLLASVAGK